METFFGILVIIAILLGITALFDALEGIRIAPWSRPQIVYRRRKYYICSRSFYGFRHYLNYECWFSDPAHAKAYDNFYRAKKKLDEFLKDHEEERAIKREGTRVVTGPVELGGVKSLNEMKVIRDSKGNPLGINIGGQYHDLTSKESVICIDSHLAT